jgi:hypothetical protein
MLGTSANGLGLWLPEQVGPNLINKHVSVTNSATRGFQATYSMTVILSPNMLYVDEEARLKSLTISSYSVGDQGTTSSFVFLGVYLGSATRPGHCLEER